jgi:hypothetical protein
MTEAHASFEIDGHTQSPQLILPAYRNKAQKK